MKPRSRTLLFSVIVAAGLTAPALAADQSVHTRFGSVGVRDDELTFKGTPLSPKVLGNNGLSVFQTHVYQLDSIDTVIITDVGGSLCPAQFLVATVSKSGIKASTEFGNCGDGIDVNITNGKLVMTQPAAKIIGGKLVWTGGTDTYVYDPRQEK